MPGTTSSSAVTAEGGRFLREGAFSRTLETLDELELGLRRLRDGLELQRVPTAGPSVPDSRAAQAAGRLYGAAAGVWRPATMAAAGEPQQAPSSDLRLALEQMMRRTEEVLGHLDRVAGALVTIERQLLDP